MSAAPLEAVLIAANVEGPRILAYLRTQMSAASVEANPSPVDELPLQVAGLISALK